MLLERARGQAVDMLSVLSEFLDSGLGEPIVENTAPAVDEDDNVSEVSFEPTAEDDFRMPRSLGPGPSGAPRAPRAPLALAGEEESSDPTTLAASQKKVLEKAQLAGLVNNLGKNSQLSELLIAKYAETQQSVIIVVLKGCAAARQ
ncbi:uncharacterized protein KY384_008622 [Bacidia gigantensis]|uniref:uncharacterized protein n=1 Tax=Bacidia gigantensis TaxID=2732470 RepID=UPI001D0415BA|nr:uncharacterized protein KY384_008622 [Bacidia gigantensis]KAG8527192.1 hypothetical protein KY384_008622 [Bacidia gigantensis]